MSFAMKSWGQDIWNLLQSVWFKQENRKKHLFNGGYLSMEGSTSYKITLASYAKTSQNVNRSEGFLPMSLCVIYKWCV